MGTMRMVEGLTLLAVGSCLWGGCGADEAATELKGKLSAIRLSLQFPEATDVHAIQFDFTRVTCDGEAVEPSTVTSTVPLSDITLTGGIPGFVSPLDANSKHVFADKLMVLPAGCYDVTTTPLAADGSQSKDCYRARQQKVRVADSFTTEVVLINQCRGQEPRGAIDAVAVLNQPPVIESIAFAKSKFGYVGVPQTICVTARDPNDDPIAFVWDDRPTRRPYSGPVIISHVTNPDLSVVECVAITPLAEGQYRFRLEAFDEMRDAHGNLIFVESLIYEQSSRPSHDTLTFAFYSVPPKADGEPCTTAADCSSGVCATCYPDQDGDGQGAKGSTGSLFCGSTPPAGFALRPIDCCDSDPRAFDGQSEFFTVPDNCGSFDYNCNGIPEQAPPFACAHCSGGPDTCSPVTPGWCTLRQDPTYGPICVHFIPCEAEEPACGQTGPFVISGGSCVALMSGPNFVDCALSLTGAVVETRTMACH